MSSVKLTNLGYKSRLMIERMTTTLGMPDGVPRPAPAEAVRAPAAPAAPKTPDVAQTAANTALAGVIEADLTANPPRIDAGLADAAGLTSQEVTRTGLSPQEIQELGTNAAVFIRDHPIPESTGFIQEIKYEQDDLMVGVRNQLPVEIGQRFDAHGIAKGGYKDQLAALNTFLTTGIDQTRDFHTVPLKVPPEIEAQVASAMGGLAYDTGNFIILSKPDGMIETPENPRGEIAAVLVNEAFYDAIPRLQEAYPGVKFIRADQMTEGLQEMLTDTKGQGEETNKEDVPLSPTEPPRAKNGARIKSFTTDHGSVYTYDSDGKTTRFKTETGEQHEKQGITVFMDLSAEEAQQVLEAVQIEGSTLQSYIVERQADDSAVSIANLESVTNPDNLYLVVYENGKPIIIKKASLIPAVGKSVYDTRKYQGENGETLSERHLGNKVTSIETDEIPPAPRAPTQPSELPNLPEGFTAGAPRVDASAPIETTHEVVGANEWDNEGPTGPAPVAVEKLDPTIDYGALAQRRGQDLVDLWGNLNPEQIQSDPDLSKLLAEHDGDINSLITSLREAYKDQGLTEAFQNKRLSEELGRLRSKAERIIGKEKADQIIKEAREKRGKPPERLDFYEATSSEIARIRAEINAAKKSGQPIELIRQLETELKKAQKAYDEYLFKDQTDRDNPRTFRDIIKEAKAARQLAKKELMDAQASGDPKRIEEAERKYLAYLEHYKILNRKKWRQRADNFLIYIFGILGKELYRGSGIGQTIQGQGGPQH